MIAVQRKSPTKNHHSAFANSNCQREPLTKSTTLPPAENTASTTGDNYLEAEPLNGYPALYAYFDSELKYPEVALRDSIQGTESVSFIINKGEAETITILHSTGSPFDEESEG